MTGHEHDRIAAEARRTLTAAADQLDADTRRRLAQARHAALDALGRPRRFGWGLAVTGVAASVAIALLAATLWLLQPAPAPFAEQTLADLDLLATPDNPELYVDFEFYQWLASQDHAG